MKRLCIPNTDFGLQEMLSNFALSFRRMAHRGNKSGVEPISHAMLLGKCIKDTTIPLTNSAFLPFCWHANFLDDKMIRRTLADFKEIRSQDMTKLLNYVNTEARTVFLLLVFIGKVNNIGDFYLNNFKDSNLPILFTSKWEGVSLKSQDSKHAWQCFLKWTTVEMELFTLKQWVFLAPVFSGETFFYKLEPKQPLPFKHSGDTSIGNGYFGTVYKIEIPSSHLYERNVRYNIKNLACFC
jgi:hypothetical protein